MDIQGTPINEEVLVRDWLYMWLGDIVEPGLSVSTFERYSRIIERHLAPNLGEIKLREVSPWHIRNMNRQLMESGMAGRTVELVNAVLSGAYKYALQMDVVVRNPVSTVPTPKYNETEINTPDVVTVKTMLDWARESQHRLYPLLHFIIYTGVRRGEALALRWHNVNLDNGCVHIVESAIRTSAQGMIVKQPKTARSIRTIDLDDETTDMLRQHRTKITAAFPQSQLVFPGPKGNLLRTTTITNDLKAIGKQAGLPEVTFHMLRHFHASVALQQRQNIVVVSRRLGHSSVTTTLDVYGHSIPGWQKEVANAFAQTMGS